VLTSLQIRDFAIVDQIDIEFGGGMTVLTGETGAGKSILVDAIGLVLGERGSSQLVRKGAKRAEFSAEFDLSSQPESRGWLKDHALDEDENCLIRRVINADGRSRAFINGNAATLQQLKSFGELLLDIHGQHFHQSLGRRNVQRDLLDFFGGLQKQRSETERAFERWQSLEDQWRRLQDAEQDRASRLDLLAFQVTEFDALGMAADETRDLQFERQRLQHSGRLAEGVNTAIDKLSGHEIGNANRLVAEAHRAVAMLVEFDAQLGEVTELLESANIQIAEASDALERYAAAIDMDPDRRDWVEERLDAIQAIARKHRVAPEELPNLAERLKKEHDDLENAEELGRTMQADANAARTAFVRCAKTLSEGRSEAAKSLAAAVSAAMEGLGMPGGRFEVAMGALPEDQARPWGLDDIEFLISANPGQPPMPLSRVASGGELSRMSLAIQVIVSDGSAIPTMVFDEVDSGVGGRVAEMVGRRLQELGNDRQVLCVTHLPQVASLADAHFRVSKVTDGKATRTGIHDLGKEERVEEIARMLGGVEITKKTLDHAAEMLAGSLRKRA
jgi:DNA repair protein RecN (Recombination protein N)